MFPVACSPLTSSVGAQNKLPFDVNLQLGAGLVPLNGTTYDAVAPNATVTLSWTVPASAGPGSADGAAVAYTYRSSIDPQAHENAGLIGALVVSSQVREAELRFGVYGSSAAGVRALAVRFDLFQDVQAALVVFFSSGDPCGKPARVLGWHA